MSLRPTPARRLSRPLAWVAALLLVTGCGTGMKAQTYLQQSEADTTNDAVGRIAVRNLAVLAPRQGFVHPAGSTAPVILTLVNEGGEDDQLVRASSPAAASVAMVPQAPIAVPRLGMSDPRAGLELRGLTRDLATGQYVDLTLEFRVNGTKTFIVPVHTVPQRVAEEREYRIAETDSEGHPLDHGGGGAESGEAPHGDAVPDPTSETHGDNSQDPPVRR